MDVSIYRLTNTKGINLRIGRTYIALRTRGDSPRFERAGSWNGGLMVIAVGPIALQAGRLSG